MARACNFGNWLIRCTSHKKPRYVGKIGKETASENERYNLGKYAAKNGKVHALRKFKTDFPKLSESTVRSF